MKNKHWIMVGLAALAFGAMVLVISVGVLMRLSYLSGKAAREPADGEVIMIVRPETQEQKDQYAKDKAESLEEHRKFEAMITGKKAENDRKQRELDAADEADRKARDGR